MFSALFNEAHHKLFKLQAVLAGLYVLEKMHLKYTLKSVLITGGATGL
jgi:hypothetical protein